MSASLKTAFLTLAIFFASPLAATSAPPASAAAPERPKLAVLIVAASDYSSSGFLSNLEGTANDAVDFYQWALKNGATKSSVVALGDKIAFKTAAPTYASIRKYLEIQANVDCETLVVFLAGHGVGCGGKSFFCPIDAEEPSFPSDIQDEEQRRAAREANLLPIASVVSILRAAKADRALLIVDAARDSESGDDAFVNEFDAFLEPSTRSDGKTFGAIMSCSYGESSRDTVVNGRFCGAFTHYFLEGLEGAADRDFCPDGRITWYEAYEYARSRVASETRGKQTPEFFFANCAEQPVLARCKPTKPSPNDSDLQFLINAGVFALAEDDRNGRGFRFNDSFVNLGLKWLDAALEVAPNNALALETRGRARRDLGDYRGALADFNKLGAKLQVYAQSPSQLTDLDGKLLRDQDNKPLKPFSKGAVLTITAISEDGKRLYATEIDNALLAKGGWTDASNVGRNAPPRNASTLTVNSPILFGRSKEPEGGSGKPQSFRARTPGKDAPSDALHLWF